MVGRTILFIAIGMLLTVSCTQETPELDKEDEILSAISASEYKRARDLVIEYYSDGSDKKMTWLKRIDILETDYYRSKKVRVIQLQSKVTDQYVFCDGKIFNDGEVFIRWCKLVIKYLDQNKAILDTIPTVVHSIPARGAKSFEIMNSRDERFDSTSVEIRAIELDRNVPTPKPVGKPGRK